MENVHRGSGEGVGFYRGCHGDGGRLLEVAVARSFTNDEQLSESGLFVFSFFFFFSLHLRWDSSSRTYNWVKD